MQLDCSYPGNKAVKLLRAKFGDSGAWAYLVIGCHLMGSTNGELSTEELEVLRTDTSCEVEQWGKIITHLFASGWLYQTETGAIRSPGTDSDLADLKKKSDAGKRGGEASGVARRSTVVPDSSTVVPFKSTVVDVSGTAAEQQPSSSIYPSSYSSDLGKGFKGKTIIVHPEEFAGLVVNNFHGDEAKARDMCEAADENATAKSLSFRDSVACAAYVQGWQRKSKQFDVRNGGPAPPPAESSADKWLKNKLKGVQA